ncbi:hypothetical protein EQU24_05810 [Methylotuvimicrobium buryatense]|uniref:Uncharacterized protein n=1 Tax=Methylotuvimicrobium buryatense TaxID=95641 RepID=A0A4P9UL42_METBY|nr:hypothetical protein EQU24_05810 [Methylotuvimicrobium buryatense]
MLGEDVGSRADFCSCKICIHAILGACRFLLLGNCSCIALLHAILGARAAAKPPWMGLRRSSTGIPHTLKSAKLLKLGIAGLLRHCRNLKCERYNHFWGMGSGRMGSPK